MKNVILLKLLLMATIANTQPVVQPISSGDYWQIDEFQNRLPELANKTTFPATLNFTNGFVGIINFYVNRLTGENEIVWNVGTSQNVSNYVVEWSRDLRTFERAAVVRLESANNGRYTFRHSFYDKQPVYYRIGIVTGANTITYTPAVQVLEEEASTRIFPTVVQGSTFYIQTARAFEKLQVLNSASQSVYEKGINGQTGTITVGLPALPKGIYFVRLLDANRWEQVQRILVE
ncbi:MAG: hypothetical protein EON98_10765 [Chitinophagaceae bacterium]|nr:MAG: hypothetical protein EON98_10765 [Chitinophagaceae bacterium]